MSSEPFSPEPSVAEPVPDGTRSGRAVRHSGAAASGSPLKKAVDALAVVPTKERIFPLARKLYNVLLYFAQRQGLEEVIYRAPLRELVRVVEFNSHNTEVIKNHLRQLVTTKVEWQSPSVGEGARWSVSALIAHCDLITLGSELMIEWSYAPNIKQQLLDPQRYARISLVYQSALRSMASLVLYEICTRYIDNPGRLTARQTWQWWRPVLTGTPESEVDTYQQYKYFKRDVLKSAIAEINAVTDLDIELIEHRTGRTVNEIQFRVQQKERPAAPLAQLLPLDLETVSQAIRQGVSQEQAEQLITRHGEPAVAAALKTMSARTMMSTLPPIETPGKFLAGILRNRAETRASPDADTVKAAGQGAVRGMSRAALIERYRAARRATLEAMFNEMPVPDRDELVGAFRIEVLPRLPAVLVRGFDKQGLHSPMVKAEFYRWLAHRTWGEGWERPSDTDLLALVTTA